MSRMPGAAWVPLPRFSTTRMSAHDIVCIHTMVGSLMGTDAYFRSITTGVNSHYGTGGVGEPIRQWGDTAFRSGANLDGNGNVISVENADMGPGFPAWDTNNAAAVPPFTEEQCEDIAQILAWECSPAAHVNCPPTWVCHREGIPLGLIPDALPGRRGIGYHRQGVPGFMVPGAVKWSSSTGKVCPTDRRVAQLTQIIARARAIGSGASKPIVQEDTDMKLIQSAGRGIAVVGPGYYKSITAEELDTAVTLYGKPNGGGSAWNDRQFDLARSIALNGVGIGSTAAQLTAAVASLAGLAAADVDEEALAAALAAKLSGTSQADVAEALREVLREGVGAAATGN